jgi:hypothetical protein
MVPISCGKVFVQNGGRILYVIDRAAGKKFIVQADRIRPMGIEIEDIGG